MGRISMTPVIVAAKTNKIKPLKNVPDDELFKWALTDPDNFKWYLDTKAFIEDLNNKAINGDDWHYTIIQIPTAVINYFQTPIKK